MVVESIRILLAWLVWRFIDPEGHETFKEYLREESSLIERDKSMDENGVTLRISIRAFIVFVFCFAFAFGFYSHGQWEQAADRRMAIKMGESAVRNLNTQLLSGQGINGSLEGMEKADGLYVLKVAFRQGNVTQESKFYMTETGKLVLLGQGGGIINIGGK